MRSLRKKIWWWVIGIWEKLAWKVIDDVDLKSVEKLLLKERFQKFFSVTELREKDNEWIMTATEKKELIPKELEWKDTVLNWYKEEVEVIDFPFAWKSMYIHFIRRRWRERGWTKSYFNEYDLHPEWMKATKEFGDFLKELNRKERNEFFCAFKDIRHIREEDF